MDKLARNFRTSSELPLTWKAAGYRMNLRKKEMMFVGNEVICSRSSKRLHFTLCQTGLTSDCQTSSGPKSTPGWTCSDSHKECCLPSSGCQKTASILSNTDLGTVILASVGWSVTIYEHSTMVQNAAAQLLRITRNQEHIFWCFFFVALAPSRIPDQIQDLR